MGIRQWSRMLAVVLACQGGSLALADSGENRADVAEAPAAASDTSPAAAEPAAAEPAAEEPERVEGPSEELLNQARTAYALGQSHYDAGEYEQALAAFERAFALVPNPVVLIGIAESLGRLQRPQAAVAYLERYLVLAPDAPDRDHIEGRIEALRALPAVLRVTSDPPGALVHLDGELTELVTPAEIELAPGHHVLKLLAEGHDPLTREVTLTFGERRDLQVELGRAPDDDVFGQASAGESAAPLPAAPDFAGATQASVPTSVWVAAALGGASLVTGTVLGFMALAEESDFQANPTEASADRGERLALFADVAFGLGAMAIITALVLYATAGDDADDEELGKNKLQVAPVVSNRSVGLGARWQL